MSKKPLVEDYQQQTPYMAEAIVRAMALRGRGRHHDRLRNGRWKHQLSEAGTQLP